MVDYMKQVLPYKKRIIEAGAALKYLKSGIYCIKLKDTIVYIGKSKDMFNRIATHMMNIEDPTAKDFNGKKYKLLRAAKNAGYQITFDVLFYCPEEDLDLREGEYIRKYMPALNTQIPKVEGGWEVNNIKSLTLPQLLSLLEDRKN